MKFSSLNKLVIAAAMAVAMPMAIMAATPGAGLFGTHHDFASGSKLGGGTWALTDFQTDGAGNADTTANHVGLCSYCHTPHGASSTALLWNHNLSTNTFSWDETKTTGGTTYATITPAYKGPSVKCLSCHDGSVAIGDVSNYMEGAKTGANVMNTYKVGQTGGNGPVDNVGVGGSMKGAHPIGVPYPYGQLSNTYNGISTGSAVVLTEFVGAPENTNGTKVKLYNQVGASTPVGGGATGTSGIECSSCHDVHNKQATYDLLLRGNNVGSQSSDGYLCLQCHIK